MAHQKKFSLTSVVWMCFCLGGVAICFTSVQGSTIPTTEASGNSTEDGNATTATTVPTATNTTGNDTTTAPPDTTPGANVTSAAPGNDTSTVPASNTTINPNVTTEAPGNNTTEMTSPGTSPVMTGTTPSKTTTQAPKSDSNKFDVASFFGGMALAVGLTIIIFVVVRCYTQKKKTSYHAM